jgi:hypothetical protein
MKTYRNPLAVEPSNPYNNVSEMAGYLIDDADTRSYSEPPMPEWLARDVLGLSESAMRHALP